SSLFHWGASDAKCPCRRRLNSDVHKSDREKLNRWLGWFQITRVVSDHSKYRRHRISNSVMNQ
ncbi:hypothetical protein F3Q50_13665, partial [Salmonella enterica subsp. enterica]|nr:hypothetical protein [Salmonella enterica subsp. enterica]ECV9989779.1 hypothetical protein [Salmonella enterica subsp. enterica]